jgi:hypothetical protein
MLPPIAIISNNYDQDFERKNNFLGFHDLVHKRLPTNVEFFQAQFSVLNSTKAFDKGEGVFVFHVRNTAHYEILLDLR